MTNYYSKKNDQRLSAKYVVYVSGLADFFQSLKSISHLRNIKLNLSTQRRDENHVAFFHGDE